MTRSKTAFPLTAVKIVAFNKSAALPEISGKAADLLCCFIFLDRIIISDM